MALDKNGIQNYEVFSEIHIIFRIHTASSLMQNIDIVKMSIYKSVWLYV